MDILEAVLSKNDKTVERRVFVPGDLRNRFKGKCATQGKTMSEVIAAFMENYTKDDSKEAKEAS